MLSDFAAVHSALLTAVLMVFCSVWDVGSLPPFTLSPYAVCSAAQRPTSGNICGETPFAMSSSDTFLYPFCCATAFSEDSPACACAWVTEMPFAAAAWSMTANLISQDSTADGICAEVSRMLLP